MAQAKRYLTPAQGRAMQRRTRLLAALFAVVCFGGLLARLYRLQILDPDGFAARAADQQLRDTAVPAARGEIYAANGVTLAASETCWTIRAAPRELEEALVQPAAEALSKILELDYAETLAKFSKRTSNDCLLRRRVDKTMADAVRSWCVQHGAAGIQIRQDTRRVYPEGDFMGCLLGFTDVDNAGLWGLELKYNTELTGTNGAVLTAKNAWGYDMPTHYSILQAAVPGNDLTLTIDSNIQHYLESALTAAVAEHHVAARAVGIVMDVRTGAVLAMSTKPDYDPNTPRRIVNDAVRDAVNALEGEARSAALQTAQQAQWRNKAISDLYEPGSVFKLVTCAAALDTGVCTKDSQFVCAGHIGVAGTRFRCANGHIHGLETLAQGLAVSCNPCFIQVGARLGKQNFCNYFAAFGLREATGIDLPGEIKRSEYYTADKMGPVELASCSFGQSSKISYLQMLTATCAVVNGGNLMQPYLVSKITDADGQTVREITPTVRRRVLSAQTSATMRELMEGVVTAGTGKNAAVAGYRVGGKSGTSQKLDSEDERARIASFVAVAPINDPRLAVMVCLDEPHSWTTSGGALSGPVCAEVLAKSLPYLGIAPQYTEEEQKKYFTTVPDVTGWTTTAATQKLSEYTLTAKLNGGQARVTSQYPAAGSTARRNSVIVLDTTGSYDAAADEADDGADNATADKMDEAPE